MTTFAIMGFGFAIVSAVCGCKIDLKDPANIGIIVLSALIAILCAIMLIFFT